MLLCLFVLDESTCRPSDLPAPLSSPLPAPSRSAPAAAVLNVLKVFAERLYDMLRHGRGGGAQQPGFYPLAYGTDGREATRFLPHPQQYHHERNDPPSSFVRASASPSSDSSSVRNLPHQYQHVRNDSFESTASAHRGGGGGSGEGGCEMGMSDQGRQTLLARCRSGPSSAAAEQDRQLLLARSRSGPAGDDYFYHNSSNHHLHYRQHHDGGLVFDRSPDQSRGAARGGGGEEGGRVGGEYSFEGARYGSHSSGPSGVLPPLPSLNFDQFAVGGGVDRRRRAPWHGADSAYVQ